MPPKTSMANITAHALPSGYGEKLKIGHPTNDPRPFLRQTRKPNSITNPPFTRKAKPSAPNREEVKNIKRSQFEWSHTWLHSPIKILLFTTTEGHDSDKRTMELWGSHLGPQQRGAQRSTEQTLKVLIVGMGKRERDEHGPHYRSCATEWGWREDENRPPYKRPKAILQENPKTQLDYQPTFHTKRGNGRK